MARSASSASSSRRKPPPRKRGPKPRAPHVLFGQKDPLRSADYLPPHLRAIAALEPYTRTPRGQAWKRINADPVTLWKPGLKSRWTPPPAEIAATLAELRRQEKNAKERARYRKKVPTVKYKTRWSRKDRLKKSRCKRCKPSPRS